MNTYPLPDSLYPGSKDWIAADYAGRVEWLHVMYEAIKREREELVKMMASPDKSVQKRLAAQWGYVPAEQVAAERERWAADFEERGLIHGESSRIYARLAGAVRAGADDAALARLLRAEVQNRA